jgi:hypothetical protein
MAGVTLARQLSLWENSKYEPGDDSRKRNKRETLLMVENTLQQFIYGQSIIADVPSNMPDILGISEQLNPEDALALYQHIAIDPMWVNGIRASQAVALVSMENDSQEPSSVLARAHFQNEQQALPVYHYILLPRQALLHLGDVDSLLKLFEQAIPHYSASNTVLEPLHLPLPVTWTMDKGVALLKTLLDNLANGDMRRLLLILGAALDKGVIIRNFKANAQARLQLVRGLLLLLPAPARPYLTFTTNTNSLDGILPRIVFSDVESDTEEHWQIDWQNPIFHDVLFFHPYIAHLYRIWDDDMIALVRTVRNFDVLASFLMRNQGLDLGLTAVVQRHQLDLAVLHGEAVKTEALMTVLQDKMPLEDDLRLRYMRVLLKKHFESRDPKEAHVLVQQLENYPPLDSQLKADFDEALETQPDALYALARVQLGNEEKNDEKWLKRLHQSAENSLQIAIQSSDSETIFSWLTLLAREPSRYALGDILYDGILAASNYASTDNNLAQGLLILAVKRQVDALPGLLENGDLLATLPELIQAALCDYDSAAIDALANESRELFLLALHRAAIEKSPCISPMAIRHLWVIHTQQKTNTLPSQSRPLALIQALAHNHEALLEGALANLLTLMLIDGQDKLFFEIVPPLVKAGVLPKILVEALAQSERLVEDILAIVNTLHSNNWLAPQQTVDTYTFLLTERNWDIESLPLIEQLARTLNQYADTDTTTGALWKLAELSGEPKNEQMLRAAIRRLLDDIGDMITENQVLDSLLRLRKAAQWSSTGRAVIVRWWRAYTREQNLVQLQKLDKALDAKRNNNDLRSIVQTTIALRRVITGSLAEFADSINQTYRILQALSEGFDPSEKLVDSATIRGELDARMEELPSDVRHVLATNLKELAQLVTTLSDNRSKPSLIRSDESVERQLVTGEQQPQSAIDVMRWLSGYLDGVQKDTEAEA